ncbi:hypothetical protein [Sporolactobacillus sp. KGMB 08714]|uniref:hypothetical protein n=1 Tax=Sporolactobacillus sp. KGMB 08714 TaxID=3064704 RepID=UPI002FBE3F0A
MSASERAAAIVAAKKEFISLLSLSGENTDELEKKMWADEDFFDYFILYDQPERGN